MKCLFLMLVSLFLISQYALSQDPPVDCRQLLDNIGKKLDDKIKMVAAAGKIEARHLVQLDEWFSELKAIADNNSFGLFAGSSSASQTCAGNFEDIFRNFFRSGKRYLFQAAKYPTVDECTGLYVDEENTLQTMGMLKKLSFVLRATYPLSDFRTLNLTEKKTYTAFYNNLVLESSTTDPDIYAFFYTHQEDIKKATGFDPNRGTQDSKTFAQNFMLSFRPHLLYYFGVAEEEFANVDASDIRTAGVPAGFYRKELKTEMVKGLELIAAELNKLKVKCSRENKNPPLGFTSTVTNYRPDIKTAKVPERPTGEAGILKPGYGWVLLGILDANGAVYKQNNDRPLVGFSTEENGKKKWLFNVTSSQYHQVPEGKYLTTVSMSCYPQRGIIITAGAETNVALRLGRLVLDPRNFDGTASKLGVNVYAILDEPATPGGPRLTNRVATLAAKGGDSLDLAPGRYIVHSGYGTWQKDTITIRAQECTKLTITGAAKFTAPKEEVEIRKVVPNSTSQWITFLSNGKDIQLPPGLYEIKLRSSKTGYRLNMQRGQAYTYQMP